MNNGFWVRIAHDMPYHPKVKGLTDGAFRAHVEAICYSGKYLTNGVVPKRDYTYETANELICAGLWEEHPEGYVIHDYLDWNESREKVMALREKRAVAGRKGATKRWGSR